MGPLAGVTESDPDDGALARAAAEGWPEAAGEEVAAAQAEDALERGTEAAGEEQQLLGRHLEILGEERGTEAAGEEVAAAQAEDALRAPGHRYVVDPWLRDACGAVELDAAGAARKCGRPICVHLLRPPLHELFSARDAVIAREQRAILTSAPHLEHELDNRFRALANLYETWR